MGRVWSHFSIWSLSVFTEFSWPHMGLNKMPCLSLKWSSHPFEHLNSPLGTFNFSASCKARCIMKEPHMGTLWSRAVLNHLRSASSTLEYLIVRSFLRLGLNSLVRNGSLFHQLSSATLIRCYEPVHSGQRSVSWSWYPSPPPWALRTSAWGTYLVFTSPFSLLIQLSPLKWQLGWIAQQQRWSSLI